MADLVIPLSISALNAALNARPTDFFGDRLVKIKRAGTSGGAVTISIDVDALSALLPKLVQLYRITGASGGAGKYTGRTQVPNSTSDSAGSDLSLSSLYQDQTSSDDVLIENPAESGGASGSHALATDGSVFVLCRRSPRVGSLPIVEACGTGGGGLIPVNLSQSGGANGSATSAATYTYNATNAITSASISGGPFTPQWNRRNGLVNIATHGTGFFRGGSFTLWETDEQIQTNQCT